VRYFKLAFLPRDAAQIEVMSKKLSQSDLTQPDTGEQAVMLRTVSVVVCLVYGICKIFRRHQVSKAFCGP